MSHCLERASDCYLEMKDHVQLLWSGFPVSFSDQRCGVRLHHSPGKENNGTRNRALMLYKRIGACVKPFLTLSLFYPLWVDWIGCMRGWMLEADKPKFP